jgi:6-methylsalicylate decarboxylase
MLPLEDLRPFSGPRKHASRMLRNVAGINQVLYGTDFPYLRRDLAVNSKQRILQSSELNDSERRAILGSNASRLFPRWFGPS